MVCDIVLYYIIYYTCHACLPHKVLPISLLYITTPHTTTSADRNRNRIDFFYQHT